MTRKSKKNKSQGRNWHCVNAILNRPAGLHKDQKKEFNKKACRGKIIREE